jgi:hypothetical protein
MNRFKTYSNSHNTVHDMVKSVTARHGTEFWHHQQQTTNNSRNKNKHHPNNLEYYNKVLSLKLQIHITEFLDWKFPKQLHSIYSHSCCCTWDQTVCSAYITSLKVEGKKTIYTYLPATPPSPLITFPFTSNGPQMHEMCQVSLFHSKLLLLVEL